MPAVLGKREVSHEDTPQAVKFIRDIAGTIFSCEYFYGEKIKVLGHVVRLNKRPVHAGYGYAVADSSAVINELITTSNLAFYYEDYAGQIDVRIEKRGVHVSELDRNFIVYFVKGRYLLFPQQLVAAFSTINFMQDGRTYTLFLWVQGSHLTHQGIIDRFKKALSIIRVPDVQGAKNIYPRIFS